ncbi:MAG: tetratricopeptide repeat protein [Candidatus Methylacidiphilales bacterium]|nr:tetratricopeptide repeat protein [Candidatus Methylacidiphilales bacterium]
MNYDLPTVRRILDRIRRDPLSTESWHNLLIQCFDQKDSDSFEGYQLISDCLDNLVRSEKLSNLGRGEDGVILLTPEQIDVLVRLSRSPRDTLALPAFGKMLYQDFAKRDEAHRIFSYASKIDPVNAELHRWVERSGEGGGSSATALEIAAVPPPPDPVQPQRRRADIRRMMRVTSKVAADLVSHHPVQEMPSPGQLPTPVAAPLVAAPAAPEDEEMQGHLDRMLTKAMLGQWDRLQEDAEIFEQPGLAHWMRAPVFFLMARMLQAAQRPEAALDWCQKALAAAPTMASLSFYQATLYHELGRAQDARLVYEGLVGRHPDHVQSWANLGVLHYELEQFAAAESSLRRALELQPDSAKLWNNLVSVLVERGDSAAALEAVDRLAALDPDNAEVILKRGIVYLQVGDIAAADAAFRNLLAQDPESVPGLCYLAVVLARQGNPEDALSLCWRVSRNIEFRPMVAFAWYETGLGLESAGEMARALECHRSAVEADPSHGRAWTRCGWIQRQQGNLEEAEIALAQAVRAEAGDARAWSELALVRYSVGRYAEAAEAFMRASDLSPEIPDWPYNAGVAWEKMQMPEQAAGAYERAIKIQTDHASARINLGLLYVQQGQSERAASCFQGLVLVRPDYARGWFGLGLVYEGVQKWDEAIRSLEKAVAIDPELLEAHAHLAYVYRKAGQVEKAKAAEERSHPRDKSEMPSDAPA